jgi:outer membrane lipase/esterase
MMNLLDRLAPRALKGCGTMLALVLLTSCGGGTEQITPFEPKRLLVLGDEMSVLTKLPPQGRKYSVNALQSDAVTLDCVARPLWHQIVAYSFDFAYEECNPSNLAETAAKVYAVPGAKVDDLAEQLERAREANGTLSNTDLFTVLIGANDVLDLYQRVYLPNPTTETYNEVIDELQARGRRLGQFINDLTRLEVTGPKVIVSTMPLMNLTPYALQQVIARPDVPVLNSLSEFSQAFNTAMRVTIVNDGRFIGLVELDAILNAGVNNPSRYDLVNVTQAVCAVELPNCDTNTLVPNGDASTWLWASELWMGSTAHLNLGNFARSRALGNPF